MNRTISNMSARALATSDTDKPSYAPTDAVTHAPILEDLEKGLERVKSIGREESRRLPVTGEREREQEGKIREEGEEEKEGKDVGDEQVDAEAGVGEMNGAGQLFFNLSPLAKLESTLAFESLTVRNETSLSGKTWTIVVLTMQTRSRRLCRIARSIRQSGASSCPVITSTRLTAADHLHRPPHHRRRARRNPFPVLMGRHRLPPLANAHDPHQRSCDGHHWPQACAVCVDRRALGVFGDVWLGEEYHLVGRLHTSDEPV
jgi:hypothetical protein